MTDGPATDEDDEALPPEPPPPTPRPGGVQSPEEQLRRNAIVADPIFQAALLESLTKCAKRNRMEILNQGCIDALGAPEFPVDPEEALAFVTRLTRNARDRFYYALHKVGKHEIHRNRMPDGRVAAPPMPYELARAGEIAEELAAADIGVARTLEMMRVRYLDNVEVHDVALQFGVTEVQFRKAQSRLTARVRLAMGLAIAVIACWLAFLYVWRKDEPVTHKLPEPRPVPSAVPSEPTPRERATPFEKDALAACARSDWATCAAKLDAAVAIDPTLEADPSVRDARAAVARALAPRDDRK